MVTNERGEFGRFICRSVKNPWWQEFRPPPPPGSKPPAGVRWCPQVFCVDQTWLLQQTRCISGSLGGFTDQLGTGYWGPTAAPEVLCAPGSHYLSVKTNKGEIIAVIGRDVKDVGWTTLCL